MNLIFLQTADQGSDFLKLLFINTLKRAQIYTKMHISHPVKIDLNKKLDPKQKTIQTFNIDSQGFRRARNENPPTWEIGVTNYSAVQNVFNTISEVLHS